MTPFWLTALLDFAPEEYDAGVMHWVLLTGYGLSKPRGERGEFATLMPNDGDPIVSDADDFLRVQRLGEGPSRLHLDLHVADPAAAAAHAVGLGATRVADRGTRVMRSPGGLPFCLVDGDGERRPAPAGWRAGHTSLVDVVCLDVPRRHWEGEQRFWSELTGWHLGAEPFPDYVYLDSPPGLPLRILLQRLGEPEGDVRAHLDWATTDRAAEVARHVACGSAAVAEHPAWTVLTGPGGTYCVTDRDPVTGTRG